MKNLKISVIALFFGAAFLVSSCGPSLCDCVEETLKEKPDADMVKKCEDKYKDAKEEDVMKCLEGDKKEEEKKEE
jgi:hypothetical protein